MALTPRERQIVCFVAKHSPCTVREIGAGVGLRSTSTVHQHLIWLLKWGLLASEPNKSRTICLYHDIVVTEEGSIGWWLRYPEGEP